MTTPPNELAKATLAGGCFWCLEAAFERLRGVHAVKSGYAGGARPNPTYDQVCTGTTGHAEVIEVTYDPREISYHDLLEVFFTIHDPTQLNRQGPDVGTQYRSAIFPHTPEQDAEAQAVIAALVKDEVYDLPIVTTIERNATFWPAESNHDRYYRRHPYQPYCLAVISPKIAKLRAKHAGKLRD
ncbi:MAG: peptide-methionine (S)-S-oxide reductase MsrA [Gemmatimonadetes bacterium]|nr:peptide-methionine (S)-S-oxide reductase MsrA [Gemmatimonadota bacterium]